MLVYTQLEAESSNNDLLSKAYGIINDMLEGVTSMSMDYSGQGINRKVGKFTATAIITRVGPGDVDEELCFEIPYEITDTDECMLPVGQPMRHKCHGSTVCRNTLGSYECECTGGFWGEKGSGSPSLDDKPIKMEDGTCGGEQSTDSCCGRYLPYNVERMAKCREDFKCTSDPCKGHTCDEHSWCSPGRGYEDYECPCKDGFKKDNRGDCVRDVKTSIDFCERNTCPYHCRCNSESDGYRCSPRPGYKEFFDGETIPTDHVDRGGRRKDKVTLCIDMRSPVISIVGDNPVYYRQGDSYKELGVKVIDVRDDDSDRTVKIQFSESPGSYFKKVGNITVRYVLANEFLEKGEISDIRTVVVQDVDECTYEGPRAEFRHACVEEAACLNKVGGYECHCAKGYEGDGLSTGTGCVDVEPPVITCVGQGCETSTFRACNCVGMISADGSKKHLPNALSDAIIESNILLLKADMCGHEDRAPWETGGEEKDGEEDDREWKPEACFVATDVEYGGRVVDLTRDITRGPLERVPGRDKIWRVPHNVKDAAGNSANTLYYSIRVEEVDVLDAIFGTEKTRQRDTLERRGLRIAVIVLLVMLLFPILWQVLLFLRMMLAASKVVFFPYSMVGSREDFALGYGFLLRVKSMGMISAIERERKIASYWARLMDEASSFEED
ncbi:unnamed protein product [Ascophyllum nodosum]